MAVRPCVCRRELAACDSSCNRDLLDVQFYMPCLDLRERPCLVIGAGAVGLEKIEGLLASGAKVTVVAPEAVAEVVALAAEGALRWEQREYVRGDLEGQLLVFAATADTELNVQVFRDAEARAMLVNVVDVPPLCNFIMPAIVRHHPITIAVSTSGASPALAKRLKREIAEGFGGRTPAWPSCCWSCGPGPRTRSRPTRSGATSSRTWSTATPIRWRCCRQATRTRCGRSSRSGCARPRAALRPDQAARLVDEVAARRFGAAFCMLDDEDPALDRPGAAALRRANVVRYLLERTEQAPVLLVGEAMGYAGGRFSGIAFTAERTLLGWGEGWATTSVRPEGFAEQSGSIVHGLLRELDVERRVLLWNVVPAHPHRPGVPLSNRLPTQGERRAGGEVLAGLLALVQPLGVVPVGRTAERTLAELGVDCEAPVRHPANGGATRFRAEAGAAVRRLLGVAPG